MEMATKHDLIDWTIASIRERGGAAHHIQIAKDIWDAYEDELRRSGDLFYTWQYDLRWAGHALRQRGVLKADSQSRKGVWELVGSSAT